MIKKKDINTMTANMKEPTIQRYKSLAKGLDIDFTDIKTRKQLKDIIDKIQI